MSPPPLRAVLVSGPTAAGKSAFASELATQVHGIIVNADSMQVYREWRVLTDRPDEAETDRIPHRLYGHVSVRENYSVGCWLEEARAVLNEAAAAGQLPIVVGGTGIYFAALTEGLAPMPRPSPELRLEVNDWIATVGLPQAVEALRQQDPETAAKLDPNNPRRIARAWEVLRGTGMGLAAWQRQTPAPLLPLAATEAILILPERDALRTTIEQRVERIFAGGALDEARQIRALELDAELTGMHPVGAKELFAFLDGRIARDEAVAQIQVATQQYAKRQATWFRKRMRDWQHLTTTESSTVSDVVERIRLRQSNPPASP